MTEISMVGPDGGEQMLTGPVRMRILEDGSTTNHRLGIGEITVAPHAKGPPQHRHGRHDEGFYVLPQLETPEQLMRAVWDFAEAPAAR